MFVKSYILSAKLSLPAFQVCLCCLGLPPFLSSHHCHQAPVLITHKSLPHRYIIDDDSQGLRVLPFDRSLPSLQAHQGDPGQGVRLAHNFKWLKVKIDDRLYVPALQGHRLCHLFHCDQARPSLPYLPYRPVPQIIQWP